MSYVQRSREMPSPLPMADVAEALRVPPDPVWVFHVDTPSGAVRAGKYGVESERIELGVPRVVVWCQTIADGDRDSTIFVHARPTRTVRWADVFVVSISQARLYVWDASIDDEAEELDRSRLRGIWVWDYARAGNNIVPVLRLEGSGSFAGLVGYDADGMATGFIFGPGIEPEAYGFDWVEDEGT